MPMRSGAGPSSSASTCSAERWRISARVPTSINWPARKMATRSHNASTSLRMCDDRNTVWPRCRASRMLSRNARSINGSSPAVGSSNNNRSARVMRLAIRINFWRLPFEYARTFFDGSNSNRSSSRSRYAVSMAPWTRPRRCSVSVPVSDGHRLTSPGTYASRRCASTGLSWQSTPKIFARPDVARISPSNSRMVVVLPAPFGPRYPSTSPLGTSRFSESSAVVPPNVFDRSSVRIATSAASGMRRAYSWVAGATQTGVRRTRDHSNGSQGHRRHRHRRRARRVGALRRDAADHGVAELVPVGDLLDERQRQLRAWRRARHRARTVSAEPLRAGVRGDGLSRCLHDVFHLRRRDRPLDEGRSRRGRGRLRGRQPRGRVRCGVPRNVAGPRPLDSGSPGGARVSAPTSIAFAVAAAVGAMLRYVVDAAILDRTEGLFPWGTLVINVTGSLILGVVTGLGLYHGLATAPRLVVGTGFCGAY